MVTQSVYVRTASTSKFMKAGITLLALVSVDRGLHVCTGVSLLIHYLQYRSLVVSTIGVHLGEQLPVLFLLQDGIIRARLIETVYKCVVSLPRFCIDCLFAVSFDGARGCNANHAR